MPDVNWDGIAAPAPCGGTDRSGRARREPFATSIPGAADQLPLGWTTKVGSVFAAFVAGIGAIICAWLLSP